MKKTLGTTEKGERKNEQPVFTPKRIFIGLTSLGALGFGFWALTRKSNKPASDQGLSFDSPKEETESPGVKAAADKNKKPKAETKAPVKSLWPKSTDLIPAKPASDFPLKKGSKNDKVKELQQMLNSKYPGLIKTADGKFGDDTVKALTSKGLPTEISEAQFKVLTTVDPETTATNIYNAAKKKDFNSTVAALAPIRSTSDYTSVNEKFKPKGLVNGYNTTIVTGLLEYFTDQSQKDRLALEFTRMGLEKGSDGKWKIPSAAVSGIERRTIITLQPTKVWHNAKHMVQVGKDTVLGYEVQSGDGITVFDTIDGYRLFVMTAHVKYH